MAIESPYSNPQSGIDSNRLIYPSIPQTVLPSLVGGDNYQSELDRLAIEKYKTDLNQSRNAQRYTPILGGVTAGLQSQYSGDDPFSIGLGVAGSVAQGAAMGSFAGPAGMAIGGGVGLLTSAISQYANVKKARAQRREQKRLIEKMEQQRKDDIAREMSYKAEARLDRIIENERNYAKDRALAKRLAFDSKLKTISDYLNTNESYKERLRSRRKAY